MSDWAVKVDWVSVVLALVCLSFLVGGLLAEISNARLVRKLKARLRPPIRGKTNHPVGGGDVIL